MQDQNFLSYNAFIDKYSIKTNYLEYHKVISTLAHYKKVHSTAYHDPATKDPVDTLLSHTKVSKKIYECLIKEKASIPSRIQGKWLEERDIHCNLSIIVNWENTYCLSSLCTRESKLRAFQFKFLHRKYKIGIKQTDCCSFWQEQKETLVHLFWTCKYTQNFWKSMFEWISQKFQRCRKRHSLLVSLFSGQRIHGRQKAILFVNHKSCYETQLTNEANSSDEDGMYSQ